MPMFPHYQGTARIESSQLDRPRRVREEARGPRLMCPVTSSLTEIALLAGQKLHNSRRRESKEILFSVFPRTGHGL
jgi:hypothetical protein